MAQTRTRASTKATAEDAANRVKQETETLRQDASKLGEKMMRDASEMADTVSTKLKSVGVDTDVMVDAAKGQASELQRLIAEELRTHPLRALGIAAALGVVVGLMTSR